MQPSPPTAYTSKSNSSNPGRLNVAAIHFEAMAMPTLVAYPVPSGPVVHSTPAVHRYSGCPGHFESSWRNRLMSSRLTDGSPSVSYFGLTAFTPVRCSSEYSRVEACPAESTNRSRLAQIGTSGSKRRYSCHSV